MKFGVNTGFVSGLFIFTFFLNYSLLSIKYLTNPGLKVYMHSRGFELLTSSMDQELTATPSALIVTSGLWIPYQVK